MAGDAIRKVVTKMVCDKLLSLNGSKISGWSTQHLMGRVLVSNANVRVKTYSSHAFITIATPLGIRYFSIKIMEHFGD